MLIRRERPEDIAEIHDVVRLAFAEGGPEAGLVDDLRASTAWLPSLSLVAADLATGQIIGHVVCTRATVDGERALGLGPLAVRPDRQRTGVGHALMHAVLAAAEALDEPMIGLLGSPAYYSRFGFREASLCGVQAPDPAWGEYFQVRPLHRILPGRFEYAEPFQGL